MTDTDAAGGAADDGASGGCGRSPAVPALLTDFSDNAGHCGGAAGGMAIVRGYRPTWRGSVRITGGWILPIGWPCRVSRPQRGSVASASGVCVGSWPGGPSACGGDGGVLLVADHGHGAPVASTGGLLAGRLALLAEAIGGVPKRPLWDKMAGDRSRWPPRRQAFRVLRHAGHSAGAGLHYSGLKVLNYSGLGVLKKKPAQHHGAEKGLISGGMSSLSRTSGWRRIVSAYCWSISSLVTSRSHF